LITKNILKQHNDFGVWEVERISMLFALVDEFAEMLRSESRCKEMQGALA